MVGPDQPVDHGGLVMLGTPYLGQRQAQVGVEARGHVPETQRFVLQAVDKDDAHAGECIIVKLADGLLHQIAPGEILMVDAGALAVK